VIPPPPPITTPPIASSVHQLHCEGPASPLKVVLPEDYISSPSKDSVGAASFLSGGIPSIASFVSMPASPLRFATLSASPGAAKQRSPDRWLNHVCCLCRRLCLKQQTFCANFQFEFLNTFRICQVHPVFRQTIPEDLAAYETAGSMLSGARLLVWKVLD
jgi:hypothetical protein